VIGVHTPEFDFEHDLDNIRREAKRLRVAYPIAVDSDYASEPPGAAHGADVDDQGDGTLTDPRLYQLIRQPGPVTERTFEITFLDPGVQAYAFTFG
jgi:hypothetical protein